MFKMKNKFILAITLMLMTPWVVLALEFDQVAKILEESCIKCHNDQKQKGELRLDSLAFAKKGGEAGPAVVAGEPNKSELLLRIKLEKGHDDIMPPKGAPLTREQIDILNNWVVQGAIWPEGRVLKAVPDLEVQSKIAKVSSHDFKRAQSNLNDASFFRQEVFPIIDQHCYKCHGHEPEKMKADFWMAARMNLLKGGSLGPVVDLEHPEKSLLLELIHGLDEERIMPPKTKLSDREKAILTEWVYRAVPFDIELEKVYVKKNEVNDENRKFWSFAPVKHVEPTAVNDRAWPKNKIDHYILSQLEREALPHALAADKTTLIRRAYYDLIGLPPSHDEIQAFVKSNDPKAYENIIDRLLSSRHYGEKWGRHWLDLVRFAETNGYERDGEKPEAYKYRQWVIDAFNSDKPYHQMVLEQLAGDELPNANKETVTATGFYRLHVWDDEPADRLQSLYDDYDDILKTTTEVFMGLTVGCARCHDHKIDPIPQKDYYRMLSFFDNIKPYSKNSVTRNMAARELQEQVAEENKQLRQIRAKLEVELKSLQQEFMASMALNPLISDLRDLKYKFYRDTWDKLPDFNQLKPEAEGVLEHNYVDISNASRPTAFGYVFEGKIIVPATAYYTFRLKSDDGARVVIDGKMVIENDGIHGLEAVKEERVHLAEGELPIRVEYFQKEGGLGLILSWSGQGLFESKTLTLPKGENLIADIETLMTKKQGQILQALPIVQKKLGKDKSQRIDELYLSIHEHRDKVIEDLVLCVAEKSHKPDPTHVLMRGSAHAQGPQVTPAFLSILPNVEPKITSQENSSGRRLALAQWLTDPNHPLTARVMVNRIWQHHFGRGIVRSPNNYGMMGDAPTHPKLLDHLAYKFSHEAKWSIKAMHKYIMMSATYQMSSKANMKALAQDPENQNFWRFNMQRLSAEDIRETILKITNRLDDTYGGESVYPKISKEILDGQSRVTWKVDKAEDPAHQFRRTIYTFNKRSLVLPFIEGMDGPTTDSSCAVRFVTTQPMQALTMINSDFLREAAEDFAEHIRSKQHPSRVEQIKSIWRKATGREAGETIIAEGLKFFEDFRKAGASEEQTLQQYCLIALNLNEFIYLD